MASSTPFIALLRGINVGGKNLIPMRDLTRCFEDQGFESVRTYIQSGNVLFQGREKCVEPLRRSIETVLSSRFGYSARVVVMSRAQYLKAIRSAHAAWGHDVTMKHNAIFTLPEVSPRQVLADLPPLRSELETVTIGPGVLLWSVSRSGMARTTMMKLSGTAAYKSMTVRNHNTAFKLAELLEGM